MSDIPALLYCLTLLMLETTPHHISPIEHRQPGKPILFGDAPALPCFSGVSKGSIGISTVGGILPPGGL